MFASPISQTVDKEGMGLDKENTVLCTLYFVLGGVKGSIELCLSRGTVTIKAF